MPHRVPTSTAAAAAAAAIALLTAAYAAPSTAQASPPDPEGAGAPAVQAGAVGGAASGPATGDRAEARAALTAIEDREIEAAVARASQRTSAFAAAAATLATLPDDGSAPEVVATAPRAPAALAENERVGYDQPEWTTRRRFARTRIYVLPEGQWELEQWWRGTFDRGEAAEHRFQTEIGVGLPCRFQFDLYGNTDHADGDTKWVGLQPELRWAPADWGVIPLNPTLYLEYKWNHHENDVFEAKILLGEEITPDVHWGMNFSVEQQLGADREQELAITQAVSWTLADKRFSVGAEFEYDRVTSKTSRDDPEHQFYAGPSFQWRPTESMHVDIVPLRGWHDAHDWRVFIVLGWDFGGGYGAEGPRAPVSSKSR